MAGTNIMVWLPKVGKQQYQYCEKSVVSSPDCRALVMQHTGEKKQT